MTIPLAIRVSVLACAGILTVPCADAAEWQIAPVARVIADYVDNPRLLVNGGEATAGAVGELSATFRRLTERTELSMQPRLRYARYEDDPLLDTDDQYLTVSFSGDTETSRWVASAALARDTTLTSEWGLSGLVQANRRHEGVTLSAGPTFAVSERITAGAQAYWMDNHYADARFTGLVDYQYQALSVFSGFDATPASTVTVTAQAGELTVDGPSSATRDATLRLAWKYRPEFRWTYELSAGPALVKTDLAQDTGAVFSLDVRRQAARGSLSLSAGRDLTPTGRGVLTRRDQVGFTWNHRWTDRLTGVVAARWIQNQDLVSQPGRLFDRIDYGRLDVRAEWRFAEYWTLVTSLATATQKYESLPNGAELYRASLSLLWNGQPHSL